MATVASHRIAKTYSSYAIAGVGTTPQGVSSGLGAVELPVGTVTALLGSPLFVWLLYRRSSH
jgi:ABC-type cobalamin transport system permease subunit